MAYGRKYIWAVINAVDIDGEQQWNQIGYIRQLIAKSYIPLSQVCLLQRFPYYWLCVRRNHWSPVDSLTKGPVLWSFDVFIDFDQNKQLNKQGGDSGDSRRYDAHEMPL